MPIGKYKDFDDCVRKNRNKKNPKAYCGKIKHAVEGDELKITGREIISVSEAEFSQDDTGRMFADLVLIKAGRAKNPRNYRPTALRRAVEQKVYDGLRMFVNHSNKPPIKRDFDEMVSAVESTAWDPAIKPLGGITGRVEFFNKDFFEQAQKAKKYIGVSADHDIGITRVREGQKMIEDVHEIVGARSVDWVLYPSAGGEIIQFVRESDEGEDVDWNKITADDLKANAPELVKAIQAEVKPATEAAPDDEPDEEPDDEDQAVKRSEISRLVKEGIKEALTNAQTNERKRTDTTKKVREFVAKSGLPGRTQARIVNSFANDTEYDETSVKESVEEAKAELEEAKVGKPRIHDMGHSGGEENAPVLQRTSARESVEGAFGNPFKPKTDGDKK